jgi:hypothetical protein
MDWDIETKDGFVPDAVESRIDRVYNEFLNELESDMIKAVDDSAPALLLGAGTAGLFLPLAVAKTNFRAAVIRGAEDAAIAGAESEGADDFPISEARIAAEQALTQSEASVTTTYSLINAEIEKAGDLLGDDVDVAAKIVVLKMLIRKVLGRRRRNSMSTSTFIATASFNAGVLVTGALLGKTKKTWYTSRDERVRGTHATLHGRTVDLFESYDTPSGPLRFPGDPLALPSETINCRCRLRLS